ncbi:MAG: ABC transporter ATP-binding protein [Flavobacteriales bacterium]|nr:ABC transporter ATP-binding protein [Flavobacteriales bacterium]MEB2342431.1 ABC transporter ATP-binding protein [Flavobacteriia bacterium]
MIEATALHKRYGEQIALRGVGFSVPQGECYGLLGPNGAGKSTTIAILSTLLRPDSGQVRVAGHDLATDPLAGKQAIGVVPQELALYNDLSALANLLFWGRLYGVPLPVLRGRAAELLRLFGLADRQHDKVGTYSGGMKRRINIAAALLHRPQVLLMDEPTVGIDPQSRNLIFEVVEQLHAEGLTIIYTTHYMEEAERLCDRIGIIDEGRIIAEGDLAGLKAASQLKETVAVAYAGDPGRVLDQAAAFWPEVHQEGGLVHFMTPGGQGDLAHIILLSNKRGMDIRSVEVREVDLETIFLGLTGKQLRD